MARLLTIPDIPGAVAVTPINGPNARNSGSTTAQDGTEQTFDSIGDVVSLRIDLNVKQDAGARRERGLFRGLQIGGNAARLKFFDPDIMLPAEAGVNVPAHYRWDDIAEQTWSNGLGWSNGMGWIVSPPVVPVAAAASYDAGIVTLANQHWGHTLGQGDHFGFFPFHFGIYTVWEVIEPGQYRIWPRLRKALTTDDFATLEPTVVMRAAGRDAVTMKRGLAHTEGHSMTLTEVIDPYVRKLFE